MNRYDEFYNYRMATTGDTDRIMAFIREEWNANHILGWDKQLFLWQYGRTEYQDKENLNVVLMEDKNGELLGMIGFIAYVRDNRAISPAITVVSSKATLPMAGLEFMKRQMKMVGETYHLSSGLNFKTIVPLYAKALHHKTGYMQQYYILNSDKKDYKVAVIPAINAERFEYLPSEYVLEEISNFENADRLYDFGEENDRMSVKSREYIKKRFFDHPVYTYKKWMVKTDEDVYAGILFGREIEQNAAKIMRIVDYRGNLQYLSKLGSALHKLIQENDYEYIDLVASDLTDCRLEDAGFKRLNPDGNVVIPNYFEPFVQKNVKTYYQTNTDLVIFKADGDQDRPSRRS